MIIAISILAVGLLALFAVVVRLVVQLNERIDYSVAEARGVGDRVTGVSNDLSALARHLGVEKKYGPTYTEIKPK